MSLLEEKKLTKFLLYALGEILLIAVGILIALKISNWNDGKKTLKHKKQVYQRILADLSNNQNSMDLILNYFEEREATFLKVLGNDEKATFSSDDKLEALITSTVPLRIERTGIDHLISLSQNDSTSIELVRTFDFYDNLLTTLQLELADHTKETLKIWQDEFDWFHLAMNGSIPNDANNYFTVDPKFKNRVFYYYIMAYSNYVPQLEEFHDICEDFKKEIAIFLNEN